MLKLFICTYCLLVRGDWGLTHAPPACGAQVSKNVGITDVALVDGAPQAVVLGDIAACRSVIHVISGVLQTAAQART